MKMSIAVTGALCAAAVTTAAIAAKPTTRNRAEIPAEFRWDFSAIYPSWAAWEEGMKEMDARMDAFAKLKGTLAQGPRRAAQGLPVVRRDRQAPVPPLPLSAAAARRRHARPGRGRPLPAHERGVRQVRHRVGLVHARAAEDSRSDGRPAGSRRRRRSRRTASRSSTPTGARRTCSTTRASGCCRSPASSTTRRGRSTRSSAPPTSSSRPCASRTAATSS